MTREEWHKKFQELPCNGQKGQPCKHGCIMARNRETGKLVTIGDCRVPYSKDCVFNK